MEQPPRFVSHVESWKVCRLCKSLYSLKQSPRALFGKFSNVVSFEMCRFQSDHSIFSSTFVRGKIFLIVFVDDIIITSDDQKGTKLKGFLQFSFQTKDLRKLQYFFLGH